MAFIDRSHETLADKAKRFTDSDEGRLIIMGAVVGAWSRSRKAKKAQKARTADLQRQLKVADAKYAKSSAARDTAVADFEKFVKDYNDGN